MVTPGNTKRADFLLGYTYGNTDVGTDYNAATQFTAVHGFKEGPLGIAGKYLSPRPSESHELESEIRSYDGVTKYGPIFVEANAVNDQHELEKHLVDKKFSSKSSVIIAHTTDADRKRADHWNDGLPALQNNFSTGETSASIVAERDDYYEHVEFSILTSVVNTIASMILRSYGVLEVKIKNNHTNPGDRSPLSILRFTKSLLEVIHLNIPIQLSSLLEVEGLAKYWIRIITSI
ncbi:hypothetical protein EV368DRAFT_68050 [Lentinula lateritia]|uniref:Uncharacterized protein n=1 Tax=Lentinula aff. lateritia TaxID=2804960 RepID=A0ACC1TLA3_9AGAR|nr:hypothetical protein F5876DRAFT_69845 [Lentinula aff. lateritia]KAJ3848692.1 hypothetical protein EV368DRAFT_68050 [Lentinula lateritia]